MTLDLLSTCVPDAAIEFLANHLNLECPHGSAESGDNFDFRGDTPISLGLVESWST